MIKRGFNLLGGFVLTNLFILNCLAAFPRVLWDALVWHRGGFVPALRSMSGPSILDDRTGLDVHGSLDIYLHPGRIHHQGRDEARSMAPAQAIFR